MDSPGQRPQVLIFNPVRTASSSLGMALQEAGVPHIITHGLDWGFWGLRESYTGQQEITPDKLRAVGIEMARMRRFREVLAEARAGRVPPVKVIVGLRDPYDHLFSILGFYVHIQLGWMLRGNLASYSDNALLWEIDEYTNMLDAAVQRYCAAPEAHLDEPGIGMLQDDTPGGRAELRNFFQFYVKYLQTWLRLELRDRLGIDIAPVRLRDGIAAIRQEHAEVLIYDIGAGAGRVQDAIAAHVGAPIALPHINASVHRGQGIHALLQELKQSLPSRRPLLDSYRADPCLAPLLT